MAQPGFHLVSGLNCQGVGSTCGTKSVHALDEEFLQSNWASKHPGVTFTTILGGTKPRRHTSRSHPMTLDPIAPAISAASPHRKTCDATRV